MNSYAAAKLPGTEGLAWCNATIHKEFGVRQPQARESFQYTRIVSALVAREDEVDVAR